MQEWLDGKVKDQSARKLTEDPVFSAKEVHDKFKPLEKLYKKVTNKKKPKEKRKPKEKKEKEEREETEEKDNKEERKEYMDEK